MLHFDRYDGLADAFLQSVFAKLGEIEQMEALEEVLGSGSRRLMMLFAESELGDDQKVVPVLNLDNAPSMTDVEIAVAYKVLPILAKAKFNLAVKAEEGLTAGRVKVILGMVKKDAKDAEREARDTEAKAWLTRLDDATTIVGDDDVIRLIETQFASRHFLTPEQVEAIIVKADESDTGKVRDMRNKCLIPVGDARVIRLMFVTSQLDAARICGKLRPLEGRKPDEPHTVEDTVKHLRSKAEDALRRQRETAEFQEKLAARFAECMTYDAVATVRLEIIEDEPKVGGRVNKAHWEMLNAGANARKSEIYGTFISFLQTTYLPDEESVVDLRAFLAKKEADVERDFAEGNVHEQVRKAALEQVNVIRRHLEYRERGLDRENLRNSPARGSASVGTHRNGKPARERDPQEEEVRDARRFLTGLNYDGLGVRRSEFGGKRLLLSELSDAQILSEALRLQGAGKKPKTGGGEQKGSQRGGKR